MRGVCFRSIFIGRVYQLVQAKRTRLHRDFFSWIFSSSRVSSTGQREGGEKKKDKKKEKKQQILLPRLSALVYLQSTLFFFFLARAMCVPTHTLMYTLNVYVYTHVSLCVYMYTCFFVYVYLHAQIVTRVRFVDLEACVLADRQRDR